ncbi:hypothetical protein MACH08_35520 [Oceanobacillus kimchii]|uniref:Uncharacterized protein n=1 Tax=Oceanobacillus kimchii TaxID=746691 RepID=A0ABQ5TQ50_9BACI|nr:hypothetical protein MACH08_35520 [Oceanobacillus kimchii]
MYQYWSMETYPGPISYIQIQSSTKHNYNKVEKRLGTFILCPSLLKFKNGINYSPITPHAIRSPASPDG